MAITKIIGAIHPPSKGNMYKVLKNTIDYILNPKKTESGRLVGSIGCFTDSALQEMIKTQRQYGADRNSFGLHERLGYHFTVSFSPEDEVSPELALKIMQEFSESLLNNQHEAVYGVHTDKEHLHGHLCFNSVNMITGRKYRYNDGDWAKKIQPLTDKICQKYGLHTLEMDTGKTIEEYEKEQKEKKKQAYYRRMKHREENILRKHGYHKDEDKGYSWNDHLRLLLDDMVLHSQSMEDFYNQLSDRGFTVKKGTSQNHGDYIGLKAPGMEISRRTYQLGAEYTLESLRKRIELASKPLPTYEIPEQKILIIPIRCFARIKRISRASPAMRRYYARLYRLGVRPRRVRLTYQDIREARQKAEDMQRQLALVLKHHIGSGYDARRAVEDCQSRCDRAMENQRQIKEKHANYNAMMRNYYLYRKLKRKIAEAVEIDAELQNKLVAAKNAFEKYGFTEHEVELYEQARRAEEKEASKEYKDAVAQLEAMKRVAADFEDGNPEEPTEQLSEEAERFYNSIPKKKIERRRVW